MFKFMFQEERYALQKQVDDVKRELSFEKRDREKDVEVIQLKEALAAQNKRLDHIEARYKAEAEATKAAIAEEYAKKAVEMASKCAADFGSAIGTSMEKVLECLKEFKPVPQTVTVLPTTKEVHHNCKSCKD